ncbi:PREDICTED: protein toll-like [Polistes dominula]|uniref:Protein toll-like n=1 Tax=Polistes dominula TaxID=743375 RepID=A0ABM1JBR2_POLDO|nr:PREDICTED: protein toll-like [Polistes dominula]
MEGNHLKYIDKSAFSSNEQLSIAKFSNNMLQFDSSNETLSPFYNNRLLTELHLANNRIKHFFRDWAANKVELELLDLSYNNISTITTDDFVFWKHIVIVNLRNNNIKKIFLNNIESSAKRNYGNRHFVIDVKNNPLSCDCSLYDIVRYFNGDMPVTVYNFIELILGNLTCVQPDGTQGPLINQLDFKTYKCQEDAFFELHKNCQTRCTCYVRPYDKARILDCSYKNIPIFRIDKSKVHFVSMHALVLNFTGNHLKKIPSLDDLQEFNLIELFLSNNQISKVSLDNFPTTLKVPRLDYNVSNFLYRQDFQVFTLSGNPFICDCDNRFLYRLVLGKQHIHKDLKNVKCKDRNIPLLNMTHEQLCPSMFRH